MYRRGLKKPGSLSSTLIANICGILLCDFCFIGTASLRRIPSDRPNSTARANAEAPVTYGLLHLSVMRHFKMHRAVQCKLHRYAVAKRDSQRALRWMSIGFL